MFRRILIHVQIDSILGHQIVHLIRTQLAEQRFDLKTKKTLIFKMEDRFEEETIDADRGDEGDDRGPQQEKKPF